MFGMWFNCMSILKFASLYIKSSISNIIPGLELRKKYCFLKKNFLVTSNLMYNDVAKNKPNHSTEICSFIVQPHLFNSRHIYRQISFALVIVKLSYFGRNSSWKIKVSQIFGSWDQEIDSWFTNYKPLIPSLHTEKLSH